MRLKVRYFGKCNLGFVGLYFFCGKSGEGTVEWEKEDFWMGELVGVGNLVAVKR